MAQMRSVIVIMTWLRKGCSAFPEVTKEALVMGMKTA
jgi:hypothetical protein